MIDVCIIGGGAAGMSAALGALENGAQKVMIIEKDKELGGILNQCIHNGFGMHYFKEELTGPGFAEKLQEKLKNYDLDIKLDTMCVKITPDKEVHYINGNEGYQVIKAKSIVLATGCRERTRYQIDIPGKRLAGIVTAGLAQRYLNMDGYLIGKKVFILGSGDIGLIMARRLSLEGAEVLGVAELMPYSNGLKRNIVQCLIDFNIPLYLSHTVVDVKGNGRLEQVTIAQVDEKFQPIPGTEKVFDVDTLLLSVGLIPEIKLLTDQKVQLNPYTKGIKVLDTFETSIPGIFACGNALHVHDLVDYVSLESYDAGKHAAKYSNDNSPVVEVVPKNNVRYVVPNQVKLNNDEEVMFKYRVTKPIDKGTLVIKQGDKVIKEMKKFFLLPSEMETITLSKSVFTDTDNITFEVRIDE
ncbi:MAG: FAD-dependent oxidoreductase [Bacilli bacterium]|nr:FAD-dependent oxidoreductase [Bacilli bacterium]